MKVKSQSYGKVEAMKRSGLESQNSSLEVISLNLEDLNACLELDKIALKGLWSKNQWEKELSYSKRLCKGIYNHSNLIALGCGWVVVDELHLTAIAVHPKHRRLGLGQKVISSLFLEAIQQGCTRATLEAKSNNIAALALYKSSGFITAGCRRNYYQNGADALIQWRSLNS